MPTDEELQAHCYSCHDFSNSQTVLMKGRCPWKTLTELAYVVALTDFKKPKKQNQTRNPNQQNQNQTETQVSPLTPNVCLIYLCYISFSRDF